MRPMRMAIDKLFAIPRIDESVVQMGWRKTPPRTMKKPK
jgi:hypothetical protein